MMTTSRFIAYREENNTIFKNEKKLEYVSRNLDYSSSFFWVKITLPPSSSSSLYYLQQLRPKRIKEEQRREEIEWVSSSIHYVSYCSDMTTQLSIFNQTTQLSKLIIS